MSTRWALGALALAIVAGAFGFEIIRELSDVRPLPPPPPPRAVPAPTESAAPGAGPAGPDQRPLYNVIAARTLFNPNRTEVATPAPGTVAVPPAARPLLMGVVVDEAKSRAYLEDPTTKKVFGYAVGDQVGGGRLEQIKDDRVVIARPEGTMEVMLRDARKPKPAAPVTPVPAAPALPGAAAPGPAPAVAAPPGTPAPPQIQVAPPRTLQQLPPDFLRRRPTGPGDVRSENPGG